MQALPLRREEAAPAWPVCLKKFAVLQEDGTLPASCPSPCLSPPHPGGRSAIRPAAAPEEQVYSEKLEAIWQEEKEAIVSLQLESHNLFFLKHLHSHPRLPLLQDIRNLPDTWAIGKSRAVSRAAGLSGMSAPLSFLKKV